MNLSVQIKGLDKVLKGLDKDSKEILEDIDAEMSASAVNISTNAKKDVHVDMGGLRASINYDVNTFLHKEVKANSHYAPYVEFGTKTYATNIPAELQEYAAQFRGKGKSSGKLKDAIYKWASRKGIEKKYWWIIYFRIWKNGTKSHPFFFKNFDRERPRLIDRIKKIVNK